MIQVLPNSSKPIYEKVNNAIKDLILKNALREDDKLPSVRELALQLTVNPNTISKAYSILEEQGIIVTLKGKGTFISKYAMKNIKNTELSILEEDIKSVIEKALKLNLSLDEIIDMEKKVYLKMGEDNDVRN